MKEKLLFASLRSLARLPLGFLYILSGFIFFVIYYIVGYRKKVVSENLASAFPEKSVKQRRKIRKDYFRFLCDVIVESVKLLHISEAQLARRVRVVNADAVNAATADGKNAVLLMGHFGNWEWVQQITRHFSPRAFQVSIYHPLNHHIWDAVFAAIRSRWGAHIIPMKAAPRTLLDSRNFPWICGFIADQRPFKTPKTEFVEFLNHKTWFISGPEEIGTKTGARFFYLEMTREKRGHYIVSFHPLAPSDPLPENLHFPFTREFWLMFEQTIRRQPELWMWSHKRWKD